MIALSLSLSLSLAEDGREELFVGHTDRVVRVYRWDAASQSLITKQKISLDNQV